MNGPMANGTVNIPGAGSVRSWASALTFCRAKKGLSREELAKKIRVETSDIDLWESGHGAPSHNLMGRLYGALPLLPRFRGLLSTAEVAAATEAERMRRKGWKHGDPVVPAEPPQPPVPPSKMVSVLSAEVARVLEKSTPPPPRLALPPVHAEEITTAKGVTVQLATPEPPRKVGGQVTLRAGTFGEALRTARERRGLQQNEAAKYIGYNQTRLSAYERLSIVPPRAMARIIAAFPELGEPGVPLPERGKNQTSAADDLPMPRAYPLPGGVPPPAPKAPEPEVPVTKAREAPAAPPRENTPLEELALTMARAMAEAKEATQAYEEAMKAAVAAEEQKKVAVTRANALFKEMRERTGFEGA